MNLLERRRTLEQIQESQAEGGGDNDGRVIVLNLSSSQADGYACVSTDFGQTFKYVGSTSFWLNQYSSGSVNANSEGDITYSNRNNGNRGYIITGSYSYCDLLQTASTVGGSRFRAINNLNAFQISSNGNLAIALTGQDSIENTTNIALLQTSSLSSSNKRYWERVLQYAPWSSSALRSYVEANRDDLSKVIVGGAPGQQLGLKVYATKSYISTDWINWNDLDDVIGEGTSNVGPVKWSADGKYCGVVKNSTLFLSLDGGNSFTKVPFLSGSVGGFDASQKFNTLYIGYSGSSATLRGIYKSQDRGKSWTQLPQWTETSSTITRWDCPIFMTNDAGDKLLVVGYSGSAWGYAFYSWDGGETWNPSSISGSYWYLQHLGGYTPYSSFAVSRDHVNFSL